MKAAAAIAMSVALALAVGPASLSMAQTWEQRYTTIIVVLLSFGLVLFLGVTLPVLVWMGLRARALTEGPPSTEVGAKEHWQAVKAQADAEKAIAERDQLAPVLNGPLGAYRE